MSRRVHKYDLDPDKDIQTIPITDDARIVHVGVDPRGIPCVWVEFEPDSPLKDIQVTVKMTGEAIHGDTFIHVGSFSFVDDGFVGHVYWRWA